MTAVITGVGVVSPFGAGAPAFFGALAEGRCGIGPIRWFDASTFPVRVAGEVPASPAIPAAAHRDRKASFALAAAREARACASDSTPDAALVIALGLEQAFLEDFAPARSAVEITPRFRARVDTAADIVMRELGLGGPRVVHVSACAAGALAVAHAAAMVVRGQSDVVVCGGADSMVNPLGLGGMSRLGAPSPRNTADACRPFDRARDGLVIGEGAAMFVVEHEARAKARGARVLARIAGWGSTQDAYRATAPRPDGAAASAAMQRALVRARLSPSDIGYINAHGTGTPLNDPAECKAIHTALGPHGARVAVSSIKGAVGHLMAASGAIELAACLLAFERDLLPECDVDVIGPTPRRARVDHVLSNSFGFGGQNASVILGRPQ
jgi:3-oxoacyl-[acyl-carrier-protein] synthase II